MKLLKHICSICIRIFSSIPNLKDEFTYKISFHHIFHSQRVTYETLPSVSLGFPMFRSKAPSEPFQRGGQMVSADNLGVGH